MAQSKNKTYRAVAKKTLAKLTAVKLQIEETITGMHGLTPENRDANAFQLANAPADHMTGIKKAMENIIKTIPHAFKEEQAALETEEDGNEKGEELPTSSPAPLSSPSEKAVTPDLPPTPTPLANTSFERLQRNRERLEDIQKVLADQLQDVDNKMTELEGLLRHSRKSKNLQLAQKAKASLEKVKTQLQSTKGSASEMTTSTSAKEMAELLTQPRKLQKKIDQAMHPIASKLVDHDIPHFKVAASHVQLGSKASVQQLEDQLAGLKEAIARLAVQHENTPSKVKEFTAANKFLDSNTLARMEEQLNQAKSRADSGEAVDWKRLIKATEKLNTRLANSKLYNNPTALQGAQLVPPKA